MHSSPRRRAGWRAAVPRWLTTLYEQRQTQMRLRGWLPAHGHRRPRLPGSSCSTTPVIAGARGAICGQVMALDVHSSRPKRRSDDGQTILKAALEGLKSGSHLGKLVELRGFEPLTSCMPSVGSTSSRVHLCRSPSWSVSHSAPPSKPVAVLSCCTVPPLLRSLRLMTSTDEPQQSREASATPYARSKGFLGSGGTRREWLPSYDPGRPG
jgi:hypothetical protein